MKGKLRFLFVVSIISLSVVFSTTGISYAGSFVTKGSTYPTTSASGFDEGPITYSREGMDFKTANVQQMRDGKVGIGTTNPNDKLEVKEVNGAVSNGNGEIGWKTFSGTLDANHTTEFVHGLDASKIIHASCSFYVPFIDAYMIVPNGFGATGVYWRNTFMYLWDDWADGMLAGQPFRCVVMYVK